MYALTICQPWAWAVMAGIKRFENRGWETIHRGTLAIHAGKSQKYLGGIEDLKSLGYGVEMDDLQFGGILGTVELIGCHDRKNMQTEDPMAEGPFCLEVVRPRRLLQPIPYRGRQGLFEVPDELLEGQRFEELPCCRKCGCTDLRACAGGCSWIEDDLCSRCAGDKGA